MVMRAGSWVVRAGCAGQGHAPPPLGRVFSGEEGCQGKQAGLSQDSWLQAQVLGQGAHSEQSPSRSHVKPAVPGPYVPGARRWGQMP